MNNRLRREDYKKIKAMNREQMSAYLQRVWKRGYDAGRESKMPKVSVENGGSNNETE